MAKLQTKMHFKTNNMCAMLSIILTICSAWYAFLCLHPKNRKQQPLRNITRQHEKQIKSKPAARETPKQGHDNGKRTEMERN